MKTAGANKSLRAIAKATNGLIGKRVAISELKQHGITRRAFNKVRVELMDAKLVGCSIDGTEVYLTRSGKAMTK
jgi:hypothetical protein